MTTLFIPGNYMDRGVPSQAAWSDVSSGDSPTGHESYRVADNLRDSTWWSPGTTGDDAWIGFDTGGVDVVLDSIVLDRGHNLGGKFVTLEKTVDGVTWTTVITCHLPMTVGGLPSDDDGCVLSDGVWYKTLEPVTARGFRLWTVGVTNFSPIITGLYLAQSYRLPDGEYLEAESDPQYSRKSQPRSALDTLGGMKVKRAMRVWKRLQLLVKFGREYLADFDAEVATGLIWGDPIWITHDDSTEDGAAWLRLYHLPDPSDYDPIGSGYYSKVLFNLEEVAPRGRND